MSTFGSGMGLNEKEKKRLAKEINELLTNKYEEYICIGNSSFMASTKIKKTKALPSGLYDYYWDNNKGEYIFQKKSLETDMLYDLPIKELSLIKRDISMFWNKKEKFDEYGLVHKRGILLYGKPGCGKSMAIQIIIDDLIKNHDGLIFKISNSNNLAAFIESFSGRIRLIEPQRKVVCVIEDIDGLFEESKSTQTSLLNLLDGINQNSNIVYMATTNYPERLEERILNRPSRFDKRYEFSLPNEDVRKSYLSNSLKENDLKDIDINKWVDKTDGLTISHLRELIVSVIMLENDFEETIEVLKDMGTNISSSSHRNGMGFSSKN